MHRKFGKNDLLFIGFLGLACAVLLIIFSVAFNRHGTTVVITRDGKVYGEYDLSKDQTVEIEDNQHNVTNILDIRDGKAKMLEADCPDKLCLHQKAISVEKENIVCLPNRVVVTVVSDETEGLDGFAQ